MSGTGHGTTDLALFYIYIKNQSSKSKIDVKCIGFAAMLLVG
jgi:hypothetical protein